MRSLKRMAEKIKTKIGDVKSPAPASAMGIIGITPKYNSIDVTIKPVRTRIGFQFRGTTERPKVLPIITTIKIANNDRVKWNWPTPTRSETSNVRLSENPKIEIPETRRRAPRVVGGTLFNQFNNTHLIPQNELL
tara:strand:+ start:443 stop:847 length:405 start_codon:yes stop_codon:yes gene_type:complete